MSVQSISLKVPNVKKRKWGKPKPGESLKMLAAGSLAFAKAYSSVEKLEHELEAEIQRDKENDPNKGEGIHKWRRKCGKLLLSKYLLLFIVVLNIIDCTLVLGELILDLHHVKDILFDSQQSSELFLYGLKSRYPAQFSGIHINRLDLAYDRILLANMTWPDTYLYGNLSMPGVSETENGTVSGAGSLLSPQTDFNATKAVNQYVVPGGSHSHGKSSVDNNYPSDSDTQTMQEDDGSAESALRIVGFVFHKTSLSISVLLVLWVLLKIVCFGRHLLDRRLEVFDTFVILTSFIIDMIFVKGLSMYTLKQFVYILAFMLPWRVIRVTNSLVVAVKDHEHFRLKMLFTQKKKIEHENKQIRLERENYREQVEALKKLCLHEGIDDWKIFQSLARQHVRPGNKGAMGSFASLAFGAFGNKSTSFWSVLGTPKMRRGKSMDLAETNKVNMMDTSFTHHKNHKSKFLNFLGSSADYLKGKIRNGHHLSLDSDPGIASNFLKQNAIHQNGHIGKRLVRGETIDTLSTDSMDGINDHSKEHTADEDISKQETVDSSMYEGGDTGSQSPNTESSSMQRTQSDSTPTRPTLCRSDRINEQAGSLDRPRSASIGATSRNRLTVTHHAMFHCPESFDSIDERRSNV
ncbi:Voltage-gated hydrogen channel 1 [Mactra antiquata]